MVCLVHFSLLCHFHSQRRRLKSVREKAHCRPLISRWCMLFLAFSFDLFAIETTRPLHEPSCLLKQYHDNGGRHCLHKVQHCNSKSLERKIKWPSARDFKEEILVLLSDKDDFSIPPRSFQVKRKRLKPAYISKIKKKERKHDKTCKSKL